MIIVEKSDKERYLASLQNYFELIKNMETEEARLKSIKVFDHLIKGRDASGRNRFKPATVKYLAGRIKQTTQGFFTPTDKDKEKYFFAYNKEVPDALSEITTGTGPSTDKKKADKIKANLIKEYPNLGRKDLEPFVDNYVILTVKINDVITKSSSQSIVIKNLVDSQVRLGSYLGINEEEKNKQKALDERQSVAALSLQFQETIDEMPELMDRFVYQELKILIEKYERTELTRNLFTMLSPGNMVIEEARKFVGEREKQYE
jgi:hypothetical protein